MSLVLLSAVPLLVIAGVYISYITAAESKMGQDVYARAGHLAEQVFSGVRTVVAFGGEKNEIEKYRKELEVGYQAGKRKTIGTGFGVGVIMFIIYAAYALAFWYGVKLVIGNEMGAGDIVNVIFAIMIAAMSFGLVAPNIAAAGNAQGAAYKIFEVIARNSSIDPLDKEGITRSIEGRIEFRNVGFHYPSRPDVPIMNNFSLKIQPGTKVALVGSSGSGKSTCVHLLERFYDPVEGQILLDGVDIKEYNLGSLRSNFGHVGQEPVLFGVSIFQNIAWGALPGTEVTRDQVVEACKKANVHEFIQSLPQGYDTLVGEKGALLSGGQKQRIAIARAIIKDPKILLLDEATSALDTESERLVQDSLDNAAKNRTSIVVAHRLSTIKDADMIVVIDKGEIKEVGRHDELVARGGIYTGLVAAQTIKKEKQTSSESDESDGPDGEVAHIKLRNLKSEVTKESHTSKAITSSEETTKLISFYEVVKLNLPDVWLMLLGTIGAAIMGSLMPIFSILFSEILGTFSEVGNPEKMRSDGNFWALMFTVVAAVAFVSQTIEFIFFGIAGERLVKRLRLASFVSLIKMEVGFFDLPENGTGILCSKLATEAESTKGISSQVAGSIVHAASALIVGIVIAFINGWKLTLVILACIPLMVFAGHAEMKAMAGYSDKTKKAYEKAAQMACESVENIRTVTSLSREETFYQMYRKSLVGPNRLAIRGALISSVGFGCSQALVFLVYAVSFYYGSRLILSNEYTVDAMFKVLFSVIFACIEVAQVMAYMPKVSKAIVSATSINQLLHLESKINAFDDGGSVLDLKGNVKADNVNFNYPARPNTKVLKNFNAQVLEGKTVAIVGSSGSGKSTLVSLVQRFYDAKDGKVLVENTDVRQWNLKSLRSQMAIVGQEPVLFDMSIGENISYGLDGASQEMIEQAAKQANIHDFITSLPDQYSTSVGERGAQLSGGQKQRVAIARAIIRNPRLLLLDEATSALDSESEKVVQNALDKAAMDRTTITIAHRLSTIQDADVILVVKHGTVIEQGNHQDLIRQRGFYYSLVQKQSLNTS